MKHLHIAAAVFLIGLGILFGLTATLRAQMIAKSSETALSLPVAQSLILEHTNGETIVVNDALKAGNLPIGSNLTVKAAADILTDTAYYRGYLQFDTSVAPPQSTVIQAQLTLQANRFDYAYPGVPAPGTTINCGVYQVAEPWNSSAAWDWANNPDIITNTARYTPITFEVSGTYTVEVTEFVQTWVNGQANYGLMVGMYPDPDEVAPFTAVIYGPATISETLRPRLDIVYQAPTPTPTATPTETPIPTDTPTPTETPTPTDTPLPTEIPAPTATSQPNNPPAPTAIPPTYTPVVTPTATTVVMFLPETGASRPPTLLWTIGAVALVYISVFIGVFPLLIILLGRSVRTRRNRISGKASLRESTKKG